MGENTPEVSEVNPTDSGQVTGSEIATGGTEVPVFNVDEYKDYLVPVKLDGEELTVPLAEAISGYQRQADYTRKTQELASQREQFQFATALQSALESDPEGTINLLQRHYGGSVQQAMEPEVPEFADPLEQQVWEINQKVQQIEDFKAQQEIEREVSRLQTKYPDFVPQEVIMTALKTGNNDLEAVYKQVAYDKIMARMQTETEAKQVLTQQEQAIVDAKRQAGMVSGGASAVGKVEENPQISSVRDAWFAAKRNFG
jgi:hypothetical protein